MSMKKYFWTIARKNVIFAYLVLTPAIVFLGLVVGYPIFYLFRLSLSRAIYYPGQIVLEWIGLENFKILLNDSYFWEALKHTLYIFAISVPVSFVLALIISVCLDKLRHGRIIVRTAILLPWMIAPALASAMWRWLYNDQFGIINYILKSWGIIENSILWLADPKYAIHSIIICDIWQYTPFCIIILFAGLQDMPEELYDASKIDGANTFQIFSHITLPLIKSYVLFVLLIRTVFTLRIFDFVYTLTRGGPARSTEVLTTYLFKTAFQYMKYDYSATISIVLLLITIIVSLSIIIIFKGGTEKF